LPMQQGDVLKTYADITALSNETGFVPATNIETGLRMFVQWYRMWRLNSSS